MNLFQQHYESDLKLADRYEKRGYALMAKAVAGTERYCQLRREAGGYFRRAKNHRRNAELIRVSRCINGVWQE